jgi:hypothetical protein
MSAERFFLRELALTATISIGLPARRAISSPCACTILTTPMPTVPRPAMPRRRGGSWDTPVAVRRASASRSPKPARAQSGAARGVVMDSPARRRQRARRPFAHRFPRRSAVAPRAAPRPGPASIRLRRQSRFRAAAPRPRPSAESSSGVSRRGVRAVGAAAAHPASAVAAPAQAPAAAESGGLGKGGCHRSRAVCATPL